MEQSAKPQLNQFVTFYWVARERSFTGAARRLSLPKSTVSQHIRALEARFGVRLLERTTRRNSLTEMGTALFAHCDRIMAELDEVDSAMTSHLETPRGLLRVGVPVTFSRVFLAPLLPRFCARYPAVNLEFVLSRGNVDPVEEGLDAVIRIGDAPDSSYIVRKLGSFQRGLFASRKYLKRTSKPKLPADLASHSLLSMERTPRGSKWRLINHQQVEEVNFEPRITVSDPVLIHALAAEGVGISVVPLFLAHGVPDLVRVLPDWHPTPVNVFAIYPSRRLMSAKLRAFLGELESGLKF